MAQQFGIRDEGFWKAIESELGPLNFSTGVPDYCRIHEIWKRIGPSEWSPRRTDKDRLGVTFSNGESENINLLSFLEHSHWLSLMSDARGFGTFGESFRNPEQFFDTFFEIQWARKAFLNPETVDFEIAPSVTVGRNIKRPDFRFVHRGVEFFAECKRMTTVNRARVSRHLRFFRAIESQLDSIDIPEDLRMEMFFRKVPKHFQKNLGEQIRSVVQELIAMKTLKPLKLRFVDTRDELLFCLKERRSNLAFPAMMSVTKNSPDGTPESASIVLSGNDGKIEQSVLRTFKDARTQLPHEGKALIFVETLGQGLGSVAAKAKLEDPTWKNIWGFVLGNNEYQLTCRPEHMEHIYDILR